MHRARKALSIGCLTAFTTTVQSLQTIGEIRSN
jgi:hypothetical protein